MKMLFQKIAVYLYIYKSSTFIEPNISWFDNEKRFANIDLAGIYSCVSAPERVKQLENELIFICTYRDNTIYAFQVYNMTSPELIWKTEHC